MQYKIISFDIFQTLVDVNKRIPNIWRDILKDNYTDEKAILGARAILSVLPGAYAAAVESEQFVPMADMYLNCAEKALEKLSFHALPREISYHLMDQHAKAPFYPDVPGCLNRLCGKYTIILSSDSNHLMVDGLIDKVHYEKAFISDDLHSYKGDKSGDFFRSVLRQVDAKPEEVLHIGDSSADVLGAHGAGIHSCWLNRDNRKWNHTVVPNYIIQSLSELADILSGEKNQRSFQ